MNNYVGPVLSTGELTSAIIKAIQKRNHNVELIDRGAYVRVHCHERCVLKRTDVEAELGRGFLIPGDLENVMSSFKGKLNLNSEEVTWTSTLAEGG